MGESTYSGIAELLRGRTGFDIQTVGLTTIAHAVPRRMLALGMPSVEEYLRHVSASSQELQELIESILVLETWFFRHEEAFVTLTDYVTHEWLPSHMSHVLRVLSIPCSTGEEPYSIAMALLDAGLPPGRFDIDAVDISTRALALAQRAIYRENSFRSRDLSFRERYFSATAEGYHLEDSVRKQVRFMHDNLVNPTTQVSAKRYHVIFCRNGLIYFDATSQQKAIASLERLLEPHGLLFVGPAETSLLTHHGFTSANLAAFAYKRGVSSGKAVGPEKPAIASSSIAPPALAARTTIRSEDSITQQSRKPRITNRGKSGPATTGGRLPSSTSRRQEPAHGSGVADPAEDELETATRLADAGKLKEAAEVCERHLRVSGDSAAAYYLLGLIHDVDGDRRAIEFYRKALYLEPRHIHALTHLALLLERQGDKSGAQRLRERVQRVEERTKPS